MKLTLDKKTWICGRPQTNYNHENHTGFGRTAMLNEQGYMCCLGQFALQMGFSKEDILNKSNPGYIDDMGPFNQEKDITYLTYKCIKINDDTATTVKQKTEELKKWLSEHGIELELVNFGILDEETTEEHKSTI